MSLKTLQTRLHQRARATGGYTIDQTILIVAIIAILVTMIILTVGWNLISKSSGTKLAAQFRQIEDASGQFYATYRLWPNQAISAAGITNNVWALQGRNDKVTFVAQVSNSSAGFKNFLPGFSKNSDDTRVNHSFGSGGSIFMQADVTNPAGLNGKYLVVQFGSVPFGEVQNAERAIDGDSQQDYTAGRIIASTGDCYNGASTGVTAATPASRAVQACYIANLMQ